jgi:hypothetical protein
MLAAGRGHLQVVQVLLMEQEVGVNENKQSNEVSIVYLSFLQFGAKV